MGCQTVTSQRRLTQNGGRYDVRDVRFDFKKLNLKYLERTSIYLMHTDGKFG